MKIVADENIPLVSEFFGRLGEITRLPGRQMNPAHVQDADALIVRSVTQVSPNLLEGSQVKFVGTCTIGVDHLDQAYFAQQNIGWSSAPGCNANSVVEYVYAALCHLNINWLEKSFGIIGCGNVGGLLYRLLKAQGVNVRCYDPNLSLAQNPDLSSLEEVLACELISMHTPLVTDGPHPSFHLIGRDQLLQLREGAVLLNCGRGPVIDNQALIQVLKERADLRVVLDVWEPEPDISLELLDLVQLGSPHIAGYSYDGKLNGTEMIYQACCQHFGLEPKASLAQLVPPLEDNRLLAPDGLTPWALARVLIKQVYDIAADDARLRELASRARVGEAEFGKGFDEQRKHYPRRREFHNYEVHLHQVSGDAEAAAHWLTTLGFRCV